MRSTTYILLACAAVLIGAGAQAGDLAPTGSPASTMTTLEDVYTTADSISSRLVPDPMRTTRPAEGVISLPRIEGDDGDVLNYPYGVAWTPPKRFVDNGDGTITDRLTGLVWLEDNKCHFNDDVERKTTTWSEARDYAANLQDGQCGLEDGSQPGDWRVPNKNEMSSLFGDTSMIIPTGLWNVYFWTSSTYAPDTDHAWLFHGGRGEETVVLDDDTPFSTKDPINDFSNYVWPVRDGDTEYYKPLFFP